MAGPLLDQMPAQPVAYGAQAMRGHRAVVVGRPAVVPGAGNQIEPAAIAAAMGRALETGHEKTVEHCGGMHLTSCCTTRAGATSHRQTSGRQHMAAG
ncbi:hypothetical protein QYW49_19720 [Xanthomonas campestris]|nr:hypothetical protein [Xanthomonas campestris]